MRKLLISGLPELFLLTLAFMLGDGGRFSSILAAALFHELGHIIAAFLLGAGLKLCRTEISGVSLKYDFSSISPLREAAVCLAGPAAGIAIFLISYKNGSTAYFAGASAALSLFNLLPISYLDGGCALSAFLSMMLSPDTVWRITRTLSSVITILLWCAAVLLMFRTKGDISVAAVSIYLLYRLFSDA